MPDEAELNAPYVPPVGPEVSVPGMWLYTRGENLAEQVSSSPSVPVTVYHKFFGLSALMCTTQLGMMQVWRSSEISCDTASDGTLRPQSCGKQWHSMHHARVARKGCTVQPLHAQVNLHECLAEPPGTNETWMTADQYLAHHPTRC